MAAELGVDLNRPYGALRTPSIVAMNGTSAGVGMTFPMQLDMRIAAEDAKYGFVFTRIGLIPELGATWLLPRLVGTTKALELLVTGRLFSGVEAVAFGFANEACPAERVLDRALEIADDISTNVSPLSAAVTKRLVFDLLAQPDRRAAEQQEFLLLDWIADQEDFEEGVTAFFEKRPPKWRMSKYADFPDELFEEREV